MKHHSNKSIYLLTLSLLVGLIILYNKISKQQVKDREVYTNQLTFSDATVGGGSDRPVAHTVRVETSPWIARLQSLDCERFFTENATNSIPELNIYHQLLSAYPMLESDRFKAIRRAYEGASAVIQFSDLQDEAIDAITSTYRQWISAETNSFELNRLKTEVADNVEKTKLTFNEDIERYKSSTMDDLRELIPGIDDGFSNLLFSVRPRVRASDSDLMPIKR